MIFIQGGRRTGKTYYLIMSSAATGATILTPTRHMAEYTMRMAKEMGVTIPTPMAFVDAIGHCGHLKAMDGIYTTSVNPSTLDEAPMAYKSLDDIIDVMFSAAAQIIAAAFLAR